MEPALFAPAVAFHDTRPPNLILNVSASAGPKAGDVSNPSITCQPTSSTTGATRVRAVRNSAMLGPTPYETTVPGNLFSDAVGRPAEPPKGAQTATCPSTATVGESSWYTRKAGSMLQWLVPRPLAESPLGKNTLSCAVIACPGFAVRPNRAPARMSPIPD